MRVFCFECNEEVRSTTEANTQHRHHACLNHSLMLSGSAFTCMDARRFAGHLTTACRPTMAAPCTAPPRSPAPGPGPTTPPLHLPSPLAPPPSAPPRSCLPSGHLPHSWALLRCTQTRLDQPASAGECCSVQPRHCNWAWQWGWVQVRPMPTSSADHTMEACSRTRVVLFNAHVDMCLLCTNPDHGIKKLPAIWACTSSNHATQYRVPLPLSLLLTAILTQRECSVMQVLCMLSILDGDAKREADQFCGLV